MNGPKLGKKKKDRASLSKEGQHRDNFLPLLDTTPLVSRMPFGDGGGIVKHHLTELSEDFYKELRCEYLLKKCWDESLISASLLLCRSQTHI